MRLIRLLLANLHWPVVLAIAAGVAVSICSIALVDRRFCRKPIITEFWDCGFK